MKDIQQTLKQESRFSGRGLFTGCEVTVRLCPAPPNTGILFQRSDLPGSLPIPARLEYLGKSLRCTTLEREGVSIQTVEHLLSALRGAEIDNLLIDVSGPEIPIFDGSALPFIQSIQEGGIASQAASRISTSLTRPLFWSQGETHLIALPAQEYRISYTLHYPHSPYLRSQYYSLPITPVTFCEEIAPSRTFILYEEIAPLVEKGLLHGGGLEQGVVIQGERVLNPEGVRFQDEMVRHKILDLIGDLSLVPIPFLAHIIAIRSGHSHNCAFGKELGVVLGC